MIDVVLRMACGATLGLVLALLLRCSARRVFGAGPAFTLWLLPVVLALAPLLPHSLAPVSMVVLPGLSVMSHLSAAATSPTVVIDWTRGLVALWAIGAAVSLIRLVLHYFGLLRSLGPVPDAWASMLAEAAPDLNARRVRVHDASPAVLWALPRSLILLPADFADRFDHAATRELVLCHEFTHARGAMTRCGAWPWKSHPRCCGSIRWHGSRAHASGWIRNSPAMRLRCARCRNATPVTRVPCLIAWPCNPNPH